MDALYDVGNLGIAFGTELTRTGIFRATESFVREVLERPTVNASFAAMDSYLSEVQLTRYDRSVQGLLGDRRLAAWAHNAATNREAIDLLDRLLDEGEGNPASTRLRAELGLLNRTARPRPLGRAFDVYHSMRQPLVAADRVSARVRVATIYDMVPSLFPEVTEPRFVALHSLLLRSIDIERDWVMCNSESTRRDIVGVTGMSADRIYVAPLAASSRIFRPELDETARRSVLARYGIEDRRYVLSLCTLEPRKNLVRLVDAFAAVANDASQRDLTLVLVGAVGWKTDALFENIKARGLLGRRLVLLGYVPDEDLSALYSAAAVFAYPSLYEGFGLPALEAMQCGTPVVTSRTSSLPEVVGDAAVTIDPLDEAALAQALQEVLDDPRLAGALSLRGLERAQTFTWKRTVEATLRAYGEMLARTS